MTKRLLLILYVILLLACVLTLVSCVEFSQIPSFDSFPGGQNPGESLGGSNSGTSEQTHKHNFTVWNTLSEATCETAGSEVRFCGCGVSETRTPAALGHIFTKFDYSYTTHTSTCSRCAKDISEPHNFSEGTYSCTVCELSVEVPSSGYKEITPEFTTGFVTTEVTIIETEYAIYEIGPDVYVVNDLTEKTDALCRALETVTGLSFENTTYNGKKILIGVYNFYTDSDLVVDGFPVNGIAAYGECVSNRGDECMHLIKTNPENLFLGQSVTIAHELAHVLRYYQSNHFFNTIIEEGFAQLATESVLQYLEEHDISLSQSLCYWTEGASGLSADAIEYELYTKDIAYWFETKRNVGHDHEPYIYGDRLMRYLKEERNDYISWISFIPHTDGGLIISNTQEELDIFKAAYGDDVFEDFYAWGEKFCGLISSFRGVYSPYSTETYDLSELDQITVYPVYANLGNAIPGENYTSLGVRYSFKYQDLYINIDETIRYLRDFKGENIDDLTLSMSDKALVYLFDNEGNFLRAVYAQQIPLKDIGYIKLVGNGYMGCLDIVGYIPEANKITEEVVLFSGYCDVKETQTSIDFVGWKYQLLFRNEVTITLKLSVPCSIILVDLDWNVIELDNVTEIVLDGYRYIRVLNWNSSFDYTVTAIPDNS